MDAPRPRAASTYCISFSDSTTERMTRPPNGMRVMAIATITVQVPAPSAMAMAMARIRSGNDCMNSMSRWLMRSKRPPKKPQARPHKRAERRAEQHGGERHHQRCAAAVDDPAQRVAAHLVGAEPVLRARRLRHAPEVGFQRIVRRDARARQTAMTTIAAATRPQNADIGERRTNGKQAVRACAARADGLNVAGGATLPRMGVRSLIPDPRVEPGDDDVHHDVEQHEDARRRGTRGSA